MQPGPGNRKGEFVLFLSSAGDLLQTRDQITQLINNVVNPMLFLNGTGIHIIVDRWEFGAPKRASGQKVNDEFVQRALASSVTMVLLGDRYGVGTAEECLAVLDKGPPRPELSVFRFSPSRKGTRKDRKKIDALCKSLRERQIIVDERIGPPDTRDAWNEIFRFLLDLVLSILIRKDTGELNEIR